MNIEDIESKLREIMSKTVELEVSIYNVEKEKNLFSIGMDSMDCIKVIVAIENEFQIEFDDGDIVEHFESLQSISKYVVTKKNI
ncbi:acyl carrier protein [Bacillus wiedmannii]|nr:phosphopantetheine-binding protein [Bacillus wiedmannii]PEL51563.1 hypothetical protein CN622_30255 [Bacillus wiedmannii]PEO05784.1 hypothetical protein CN562_29580 [Bacillus wiedmannii]PEP99142.1 hypothetical protein CN587_29710 [Bacillus wiedmannii]